MVAALIRVVVAAVLMVTPMGPLAAAAFAGIGEGVAQTVEISSGDRRGYDWGNIVVSAASASVGAKAGTKFIDNAKSTAGAYVRTALVAAGKAAVNYTTSYAINKALGDDVHFSWRELAIGSVTSAITSTLLGGGSPRTDASGLATNVATSAAFSWKDLAFEAVRSVLRQGVEHVVRDGIQGDAHWNWRSVLSTVAQDVAVVGLAGAIVNTRERAHRQQAEADTAAMGLSLLFGSNVHPEESPDVSQPPIDWERATLVASNGADFSSLMDWGYEHFKWKVDIGNTPPTSSPGLPANYWAADDLNSGRVKLMELLRIHDPELLADRSDNPLPYFGTKAEAQSRLFFNNGTNKFDLDESWIGSKTIATIYVMQGLGAALSDMYAGRGLVDGASQGYDAARAKANNLANLWEHPGTSAMPEHARVGHNRAAARKAGVTGVLDTVGTLVQLNTRKSDFLMIRIYESSQGNRTFKLMEFGQRYNNFTGHLQWAPKLVDQGNRNFNSLVYGWKK